MKRERESERERERERGERREREIERESGRDRVYVRVCEHNINYLSYGGLRSWFCLYI